MTQNLPFHTFNRGLCSRLGLAREDIKRIGLAAEQYLNWMPRVLGSMSLRPGWGFLGSSFTNKKARFLPFVFSTSDKALLEITDFNMRMWVGDVLVARPLVTSTLDNGTFDFDIASWLSYDEVGGVSSWAAGGFMQFIADGNGRAIRGQAINVVGVNVGRVHALRIGVDRGPVGFKVGSTLGGDEYVAETTLDTGAHSIAFVPSSTAYVQFFSALDRIVRITQCSLEGTGAVSVAAPWAEAALGLIRYDQSGDIVFVACEGYQQWKIERRNNQSWSIVKYLAEDGPFKIENTGPVTLAPTTLALFGNLSIAASKPLFKPGHVGAIFSMTSAGQKVAKQVSAQNVFTDAVKVIGVGADRTITYNIGNVFVATWTLQQSFVSATGPWIDTTVTGTVPTIATLADGLDNQIVWYRLGVKTGNFTSGTLDLNLSFPMGSITGIFRVLAFQSNVLVDVEILKHLGDTVATNVWAEGEWSDVSGWPTSVTFHEGRLCWAGHDGIWLSVSDAFNSFDATIEGDSGPLSRTIGSGPVDVINWMMSMQRLMLGGQGAEFSCRSSSLDEPLTPTNFNLKSTSTQGSAAVNPCQIDSRGVFVQRGGSRVFELALGAGTLDYEAIHLTALVPEIGLPGIVRMAAQRQPDTRVHCVRSDGTVAIMVYDRVENVICWVEVNTQGFVEDVVVLPGSAGDEEDQVYYHVRRIINGATKRYLERWARSSEARGGSPNLIADSFIRLSNPLPSTLVTGLDYLEGMEVVVWSDGIDVGTDSDGSPRYMVITGIVKAADTTPVVLTCTSQPVAPIVIGTANNNKYLNNGVDPEGQTYQQNANSGGAWIGHIVVDDATPGNRLDGDGLLRCFDLIDVHSSATLARYRNNSNVFASGLDVAAGIKGLDADGSIYVTFGARIFKCSPTFTAPVPYFDPVNSNPGNGLAFDSNGDMWGYNTTSNRPVRMTAINYAAHTCAETDATVGANTFGKYGRNAGGIAGRIYYIKLSTIRYIDITNLAAGATDIITDAVGNLMFVIGDDGYIYYARTIDASGTVIVKADLNGVVISTCLIPDHSVQQVPELYTGGFLWAAGDTSTLNFIKINVSTMTISQTIPNGSDWFRVVGVYSINSPVVNGVGGGVTQFGGLGFIECVADAPVDTHPPAVISGTDIVIGLPYCGLWKSGKLVEIQSRKGSALTASKVPIEIGLILADTHPKGLQYGPTFDRMDDLASVYRGGVLDQNATLIDYDSEPTTFPGEWNSDSRLCLKACAPRPCTVLAAILDTDHHE